MPDILTVTLNPALDLSSHAPRVAPGTKLRCGPIVTDPGGGGINVSRVIATLGGDSRLLVAVGGTTGDRLVGLLRQAGLNIHPLAAPGDTRQSLAVTDSESAAQYRFVFPGPVWPAGAEAALRDQIRALAGAQDWTVLSGSLPPGIGPDFPAMLAKSLPGPMILDTSGDALRLSAQSGAAHPLHTLRMDREEAETLAGTALPGPGDSARFALSLVRARVAGHVIVARGPDGSVLATADGCWHAAAAQVPVRSKVGAGDSFVAAYTLALARGARPEIAVQHGAAAASAAVMTEATALCTRADAERLVADCPLSALTP